MPRTAPGSVELDELVKGGGMPPLGGLINFKIMISLFLIYVFVTSDIFTNNVVAGFPGAVRRKSVSPYGTAVQGIFLVLGYVLMIYLVNGDVL